MTSGQKVDKILIDQISPQQLWDEYISQRKPVLIEGQLQDAQWKAGEKWTDEYILQQAGDAQMLVEWRDSPSEPFGKGQKFRMCVKDFIKHLKQDNEFYYLTSSMQLADEDGYPQLYQTPLTELRNDFCLRPKIMGSLIPQQLNLWWGAAKHGSSTGLHHDFHDNLYVLLRGKKRFTMFPPDMAQNMYTNGEIKKIYPNGRIVYADQEFVNADGSVPSENTRESRLADVERRISKYEVDTEKGVKGADVKLQEAEEELEKILDEELELSKDLSGRALNQSVDVELDENDPPSFSKIDINASPAAIEQIFPKFPGLDKATVCQVEAGNMLYLPAGWFHEVKSFSQLQEGESGSRKGHMAFNFWFHPPDNLVTGEAGLQNPYTSNYWPSIWHKRSHLYQQSSKHQKIIGTQKPQQKRKSQQAAMKTKLQKYLKKQQQLQLGIRRRWFITNLRTIRRRKLRQQQET
eukprot:TRINITY_DN2457_c0_g1_i5.p1 TRINITY_DN2457_c0_g1~~TRINITY_DN2457_c0_g1_i5.p1  ORF type:complete len:505 (-),score=53.77 TRINITY_DN2457_c0_g1_i5:603-1991(-)